MEEPASPQGGAAAPILQQQHHPHKQGGAHDARSCRICHKRGGHAGLIQPCTCRGTISYAHPACIKAWIVKTKSLQCGVCQTPFVVTRVFSKPPLSGGAQGVVGPNEKESAGGPADGADVVSRVQSLPHALKVVFSHECARWSAVLSRVSFFTVTWIIVLPFILSVVWHLQFNTNELLLLMLRLWHHAATAPSQSFPFGLGKQEEAFWKVWFAPGVLLIAVGWALVFALTTWWDWCAQNLQWFGADLADPVIEREAHDVERTGLNDDDLTDEDDSGRSSEEEHQYKDDESEKAAAAAAASPESKNSVDGRQLAKRDSEVPLATDEKGAGTSEKRGAESADEEPLAAAPPPPPEASQQKKKKQQHISPKDVITNSELAAVVDALGRRRQHFVHGLDDNNDDGVAAGGAAGGEGGAQDILDHFGLSGKLLDAAVIAFLFGFVFLPTAVLVLVKLPLLLGGTFIQCMWFLCVRKLLAGYAAPLLLSVAPTVTTAIAEWCIVLAHLVTGLPILSLFPSEVLSSEQVGDLARNYPGWREAGSVDDGDVTGSLFATRLRLSSFFLWGIGSLLMSAGAIRVSMRFIGSVEVRRGVAFCGAFIRGVVAHTMQLFVLPLMYGVCFCVLCAPYWIPDSPASLWPTVPRDHIVLHRNLSSVDLRSPHADGIWNVLSSTPLRLSHAHAHLKPRQQQEATAAAAAAAEKSHHHGMLAVIRALYVAQQLWNVNSRVVVTRPLFVLDDEDPAASALQQTLKDVDEARRGGTNVLFLESSDQTTTSTTVILDALLHLTSRGGGDHNNTTTTTTTTTMANNTETGGGGGIAIEVNPPPSWRFHLFCVAQLIANVDVFGEWFTFLPLFFAGLSINLVIWNCWYHVRRLCHFHVFRMLFRDPVDTSPFQQIIHCRHRMIFVYCLRNACLVLIPFVLTVRPALWLLSHLFPAMIPALISWTSGSQVVDMLCFNLMIFGGRILRLLAIWGGEALEDEVPFRRIGLIAGALREGHEAFFERVGADLRVLDALTTGTLPSARQDFFLPIRLLCFVVAYFAMCAVCVFAVMLPGVGVNSLLWSLAPHEAAIAAGGGSGSSSSMVIVDVASQFFEDSEGLLWDQQSRGGEMHLDGSDLLLHQQHRPLTLQSICIGWSLILLGVQVWELLSVQAQRLLPKLRIKYLNPSYFSSWRLKMSVESATAGVIRLEHRSVRVEVAAAPGNRGGPREEGEAEEGDRVPQQGVDPNNKPRGVTNTTTVNVAFVTSICGRSFHGEQGPVEWLIDLPTLIRRLEHAKRYAVASCEDNDEDDPRQRDCNDLVALLLQNSLEAVRCREKIPPPVTYNIPIDAARCLDMALTAGAAHEFRFPWCARVHRWLSAFVFVALHLVVMFCLPFWIGRGMMSYAFAGTVCASTQTLIIADVAWYATSDSRTFASMCWLCGLLLMSLLAVIWRRHFGRVIRTFTEFRRCGLWYCLNVKLIVVHLVFPVLWLTAGFVCLPETGLSVFTVLVQAVKHYMMFHVAEDGHSPPVFMLHGEPLEGIHTVPEAEALLSLLYGSSSSSGGVDSEWEHLLLHVGLVQWIVMASWILLISIVRDELPFLPQTISWTTPITPPPPAPPVPQSAPVTSATTTSGAEEDVVKNDAQADATDEMTREAVMINETQRGDVQERKQEEEEDEAVRLFPQRRLRGRIVEGREEERRDDEERREALLQELQEIVNRQHQRRGRWIQLRTWMIRLAEDYLKRDFDSENLVDIAVHNHDDVDDRL